VGGAIIRIQPWETLSFVQPGLEGSHPRGVVAVVEFLGDLFGGKEETEEAVALEVEFERLLLNWVGDEEDCISDPGALFVSNRSFLS